MVEVEYSDFVDFFNDNERVFHLCLTSGVDAPEDIFNSFGVLMADVLNVYKDDSGLDYIAVLTNEGNGVIHCLINRYLPKVWYSDKWLSIHNSYRVRQEEVYNVESMCVYLHNQSKVLGVVVPNFNFGIGRVLNRLKESDVVVLKDFSAGVGVVQKTFDDFK